MTNAEIYIEKFKELETAVRTTYGVPHQNSISNYLNSKTKYKRFRSEITYCQDVRNLLQHKEKIDDKFTVEPSKSMIKFIDDLILQIKSRPKCMKIAIQFEDIYSRTLSDHVLASGEINHSGSGENNQF